MSNTSLGMENTRGNWEDTYEYIIRVKIIVDNLVKTIHTQRIYPHLNPTTVALLNTLCVQFDEFLAEHSSFSLQITDDSFIYHEAAVYEDTDIRSSLPFRLHKDGIYEITFHQGLPPEDITKFINILAKNDDASRQENDFVTLLWELGSPYITFLARDDFIYEAAEFVSENVKEIPPIHDQRYKEDNEFLIEERENTVELLYQSQMVELTVEEKSRLQAEIEQINDEAFELTVADVLLEILDSETEIEPCQNIADLVVKIIDAKITLGDFTGAKMVHCQLVESWQDQEGIGEKADVLYNAIESLSSLQRIERLGHLLKQANDITDLRDYMLGLSTNAIPALVNLMRQIPSASLRKALCEMLSVIGKNAVPMFFPFLSNQDWRIVRNVAFILGMIGDAQAVPKLSATYEHSDISVRREVIQALCLIGDQSAAKVFLRAISESDSAIRGMAAVMLGKVGGDVGLSALLKELNSKEFRKKDPAEKRLFFQGIGASHSNKAVQPLRKMLLMNSWFNKDQSSEIQSGAALALAMIGTPEAIAELESGKRSKIKSISQACINALSINVKAGTEDTVTVDV